MKSVKPTAFKPQDFLSEIGAGRTIKEVKKGKKIFTQGQTGEAVFYIQKGRVKLEVLSREGKEAIHRSHRLHLASNRAQGNDPSGARRTCIL
jgi:CRP/FNR family cyclic AMP-dependent transcriptional regulator